MSAELFAPVEFENGPKQLIGTSAIADLHPPGTTYDDPTRSKEEPAMEKSPPWEISAETLLKKNPDHLLIAEVVFFTSLLREFNKPDNPIQRYMNSEGMGKDPGGLGSGPQRIARMIDHYRARQTEADGRSEKNSHPIASEDFDSSLQSAMRMWDDGYIRPMRNEVFAKAVDWKPHDAKRALSKASLDLRLHTPGDQLLHIKEATGFTPPSIGKTLFQYSASGVYNVVTSSSLETFSAAIGAFAVATNPLRETNPKVATALLIASYIPWLFAAYKNSEEMWKMLEEAGICSSVTAKVCYEWAKRKRPEDREFQKNATLAGAMFWQAVLEVPYYAGAFLTQESFEALNEGYDQRNGWKSGIIGTNIAATFHNAAQIAINRGILSMHHHRYQFLRALGRTRKLDEKTVA